MCGCVVCMYVRVCGVCVYDVHMCVYVCVCVCVWCVCVYIYIYYIICAHILTHMNTSFSLLVCNV